MTSTQEQPTAAEIEFLARYTSLALDSDPKVAAAQKALLDQILTLMEYDRYRIRNKPQADYPKDYVIRIMEAIVAKAAYKDRAEWSHLEIAVRKSMGVVG